MADLTLAINSFNNLEHVEGLKFKDLPEDQIPDSPGGFLAKFLDYPGYPTQYCTIRPDGSVLTPVNKTRSVNEVFDITKTYFPDLTVEEYFQLLVDFAESLKLKDKCLCFSFCYTIQRYTLFHFSLKGMTINYVGSYYNKKDKNNLFIWGYTFKDDSPQKTEIALALMEMKPREIPAAK